MVRMLPELFDLLLSMTMPSLRMRCRRRPVFPNEMLVVHYFHVRDHLTHPVQRPSPLKKGGKGLV